jgi:putative tricarboxylic transport membrane protein
MTSPTRLRRVIACLLLAGCTSEASTAGGVCIAPANPGGGWDLTCRAASEAIGDRAPGGHPLRVMNIAGDGGGVAFGRVVEAPKSNDPVIVAASPSTLLGIAQHHYGKHSEKDVRWLAAVDAEPSVIAVASDAPWHTLAELVAAWRAHPDSIVGGGSSDVGGQDHMKMLLLARAAGIDVRQVRYKPLSGTPEALSALKDGAIQVYPGDVSKVLRQLEHHELRVLAVLGEKRSPGLLADVATAREQGWDVAFVVWRGFYAPRGTSDALYNEWVDRLRTMSKSPEWNTLLEHNGLTPFFVGGHDFETFVTEQITAYRKLSSEIGIIPAQ